MNFVHLGLLASGVVMSASGLVLQIGYHLAGRSTDVEILTLSRATWSGVHTYSALTFLVVALLHVYKHKRWYANAFKGRSGATRPRRVVIRQRNVKVFTFFTLMAVVSGLVALFMSGVGARLTVIEIHDKVALVFLLFVIFHTIRRVKLLPL